MKYFLIFCSLLLLITTFVDLHIGYGYYQILRWCVCVFSVLVAINLKDKNITLFVLFCIIAVLFNPIAPIYLDKNLWKILDGITGIFLLWCLFNKKIK